MTVDLLAYMPFAKSLGLTVTENGKDRVVGELEVTENLCTTGRIMHGGAIMALADTLGALGAFLNLPEDAKATTTIESKTNFLGAAPLGTRVEAVCEPVHVGGRTSVWQTRIHRDDGKAVAIVTQTQMVLR